MNRKPHDIETDLEARSAASPLHNSPTGENDGVQTPLTVRLAGGERPTDTPETRASGVTLGEKPSPIPKLVQVIKPVGEGLLTIATVAYALGYLSWAIYSYQNDLGLLPALEGQYFIAGVVPLLLIIILLYAFVWLWRHRTEQERTHSANTVRWGQILEIAGIVLVAAGIAAERITGIPALGWTSAITAGIVCTSLSAFLSNKSTDRWFARRIFWLPILSMPLLGIGALLLYAHSIFPMIPGELGGPERQCVAMDLEATELSAGTRNVLGLQHVFGDTAHIYSAQLWLVAQADEFFIVQMPGSPVGAGHVRIRNGVVHTISDLGSCST